MINKTLVTSSILEEYDPAVIHWPLLQVRYVDDLVVDAAIYDIIIISSRHAVLALQGMKNYTRTVFFVVGQKVAELLNKRFGVKATFYHSIADLLNNQQEMHGKSIAYLRGDIITQDLRSLLPFCQLNEILAYSTHACTSLPEDIATMLTNGQISHVAIYSLRGYMIFKQLTKELKHNASLRFIPKGLYEKVLQQG